MSHRQDDLVKSFLRPSENTTVTLNVEVEPGNAESYGGGQADTNTDTPQRSRRLLSIVTHDDGGFEEAR